MQEKTNCFAGLPIRMATALLSFLIIVNSAIAAPTTAWEKTLSLAKKQTEQKKFDEAEKLLQRALLEAGKLPANDIGRAEIYNLLLQNYYAQNNFQSAANVFAKLLPIYSAHYGAQSRDYAQVLRNFAALQVRLGKQDDAKLLSKKADDIENPGLTVGYVDKAGRMPIKWQLDFGRFVNCYNLPGPFSEGLAAVYQGDDSGKIVYINREGQVAIPAEWDRGLPFHDGCAQVFKLGSVALIDKTGKKRVPMRHDFYPTQRSEGLWPSSGGGEFIDDNGKSVIKLPHSSVRSFHEGLAGFSSMAKSGDVNPGWGFINKEGSVIIPPQFRAVKDFSDGLAPVQDRVNDTNYILEWGYINKQGKKIVEPKYTWADQFSEEMAAVADAEPTDWEMKYGYIDLSGRLVLPKKYDWAEPFSEGLALVHIPNKNDRLDHVFRNGKGGLIDKSGGWAFIDKSGKVIFRPPLAVQEVWSFSNGLARVRIGGLYGFMDKHGKFAIEPKFRWADDFSEDLAAVAKW